MSKVMLINPPVRIYDSSSEFTAYFPIGLLSIAAFLKNICELKIFDCLITDFEIKKTKDFTLYGTPFEKIKSAIKDFNPDIIGISIPFSTQADNARAVCRIAREAKPDALIVFGGPDASVRYESLLKEEPCDFCVIAEGEESFFEFVKRFSSNLPLTDIPGVAYKREEAIQYKPRKFLQDLDKLPFPAYELIDVGDYLRNKYLYGNRTILKESITIITSRGCPFSCVFCSIRLHMGRGYRYHSPDYVIRHIKFLMENYGITNFHFEDDNISLNKERFAEIIDKIIEDGLRIKWDTPNGLRADTLDYDLLKKMKQAGCAELTIGIESGSQRVLNTIIKKNTSLDYMLEMVKYCRELKIKTSAFYVIGFPGESLEEMKKTINLAMELYRRYDAFPVLHFATPLYGTELYNTCIKNGFMEKGLTGKDFAAAIQPFGEPLISTNDFSREDIKKLGRDFLLRLYFMRLTKGLIFDAVKHPLSTAKKAKDRLRLLIKSR